MTDPYEPRPRPDAPGRPPQGYEPPPGYGAPPGWGSAPVGPQGPQGYGPPPGYQGPPPPGGYGVQKKNGFGVASLVLGIASLVLFWSAVGGVVLGALALVFGVLGRKRVSRGEADNGGVALAGIITGAIGLVLGLVVGVGIVVALTRGDFGSFADCTNAAQTQADQDQCARDFGNSFSR